MNKKLINFHEFLFGKFLSVLVYGRRIPFIGVLCYFILKFIGVEIPVTVKVGRGVKLVHWAYGLVVHPNTTIHENVKLYQSVTFGRADIHKSYKESNMESIIVKKGAIISAGSKILCKSGTLTIGENTIIGANSVLLTSTGDNEIWAGSPAKKIGEINNTKK